MRLIPTFSSISLLRPGHPDDLVERHGGYIVAFAAGLVAFACLSVTVYQLPVHVPQPAELRIVLEQPPPPEPPTPANELPAEPAVEQIAATSVNATEEKVVAMAVQGQQLATEMITEDEVQPPPSLADWVPQTAEDARRVAQMRHSIEDYRDSLQQQQTSLQAHVNKLSVESAGRQFLLNTDGGQNGVIRTLDIADFPNHIVIPILNRYGILIEYKHVKPEEGGHGFLNAATTADGTFTSVAREGFYEVFVLTPKAVAMLASKELTALQDRGFDPMRSRTRKVKFGIIKNAENEFDLDVVELEAERVR